MTAIAFDTLKYADRLEKAGIPREQARAFAEAQQESLGEAALATKTDRLELKYDLLKWIIGLALAQTGMLMGILIKLS